MHKILLQSCVFPFADNSTMAYDESTRTIAIQCLLRLYYCCDIILGIDYEPKGVNSPYGFLSVLYTVDNILKARNYEYACTVLMNVLSKAADSNGSYSKIFICNLKSILRECLDVSIRSSNTDNLE